MQYEDFRKEKKILSKRQENLVMRIQKASSTFCAKMEKALNSVIEPVVNSEHENHGNLISVN